MHIENYSLHVKHTLYYGVQMQQLEENLVAVSLIISWELEGFFPLSFCEAGFNLRVAKQHY